MAMGVARRIIVNTLATYCHSVFTLFLALFTSRWVYISLGEIDMGLFSLVGSAIAFVGIVNNVLGLATSRFFAFSIGHSGINEVEEKSDELQRWFSATLSVHVVLAIFLVAIGYPLGSYAIRYWFVIPSERIDACICVLMLSCLNLFINVISVPFISLYKAYQLISELAFWGVAGSVLWFFLAMTLLKINGDKLVWYSIFIVVPGVLIKICQMTRAWRKFGACKIRKDALFSKRELFPVFRYAFWELFSCGGDICRSNGTAFIINRFFGPSMNAAFGITNHVSGNAGSFTTALIGAMSPAVTTTEGASNSDGARKLAFRSGKFASLLTSIFMIPLFLEIDLILKLWLVNPPKDTATLCRCFFIGMICHKLGIGQHLMIAAKGRVGVYNFAMGATAILTLPVIYGFVKTGLGALGIGISFILVYSAQSVERALFGYKLTGMGILSWMSSVVVPISLTVCTSSIAGFVVTRILGESIFRIFVTGLVSDAVLFFCAAVFVLDAHEKRFAIEKFSRMTTVFKTRQEKK